MARFEMKSSISMGKRDSLINYLEKKGYGNVSFSTGEDKHTGILNVDKPLDNQTLLVVSNIPHTIGFRQLE